MVSGDRKMDMQNLMLDVNQRVEIKSAIGDVFTCLLQRLSVDSATPDGTPMPMVLEQWPGGRWFRDLGKGAGHLWGFVQVIKPPTLLEIHGPMFMSYPAAGHVQFRLDQIAGGTRLSVRHRALGMIEDEHRQGVATGWTAILENIKSRCE
jgi:hypothetical protein